MGVGKNTFFDYITGEGKREHLKATLSLKPTLLSKVGFLFYFYGGND